MNLKASTLNIRLAGIDAPEVSKQVTFMILKVI
jgi:endonuclease YncB( thermonuclease family)